MESRKRIEAFSFRYLEDESEEGFLLHASTPRYVKIVEENDRGGLFFDDEGEGEEGNFKWKDSEAWRILYKDVKEQVIPLKDDLNLSRCVDSKGFGNDTNWGSFSLCGSLHPQSPSSQET
jgi:hypothetical protein